MLNLFPLLLILIVCWNMQVLTEKGAFDSEYLSRENSGVIKGILALVIFLHHLSQETMETGAAAPLLTLFGHIGGILPVALFFFYSGFALQKKHMTTDHYERHFLLKRVPAVLIPYLIVTLLCWIQSHWVGTNYSFFQMVQGFYDGQPIVRFSWFVLELVLFYFVFYVLMRICRKHYLAMVLGGVLFTVLWNVFCRTQDADLYWYSSTHILILGMLWAAKEQTIFQWIQKIDWPGILGLLLVFLLAAPLSHFGPVSFNEILVVLFVLAMLPLLTKIHLDNPILRFFSSISYEIYLIQGMVLTGLRNDRFFMEDNFLFCLTAISLTILFSWLAHLLFTWILKSYNRFLKKVTG